MTSDGAEMGGIIGDIVDVVKRAPGEAARRVAEEAERLRRIYAQRKRERIVKLAVFLGLTYLLLRKRRK